MTEKVIQRYGLPSIVLGFLICLVQSFRAQTHRTQPALTYMLIRAEALRWFITKQHDFEGLFYFRATRKILLRDDCTCQDCDLWALARLAILQVSLMTSGALTPLINGNDDNFPRSFWRRKHEVIWFHQESTLFKASSEFSHRPGTPLMITGQCRWL